MPQDTTVGCSSFFVLSSARPGMFAKMCAGSVTQDTHFRLLESILIFSYLGLCAILLYSTYTNDAMTFARYTPTPLGLPDSRFHFDGFDRSVRPKTSTCRPPTPFTEVTAAG